MKISRKWLNEYVDLTDVDNKTFVDKMTLAGVEYESIDPLCAATNLVVGQVETVEDHPNADKLHVCKVNIGNSIEQIICGAPNVKEGIKVIVALPGATLPGNIKIKSSKIRDVLSNGMLCALEELGLDSKYVPERSRGGIHILEQDAPVGDNALTYLELDDTVVDFDLTANRADLMSLIGMGYEASAVFKRPLKLPIFKLEETKELTSDLINLDIKTDNCYIYSTRIVKNVKLEESPNFIKARLIAEGIRPINNIVDISNYVMLEYGQPLHFFDYDKLGKDIVVRMANDKEELTTLDGNKRELLDTDIVICDKNHPVALAGVMGGLETEITNDTKTILIESAVFNPYNIRYTSKRILRSEASSRYEKGVDTKRTNIALDRAAYLLNKYASGTTTSNIVSVRKKEDHDKTIDISLTKINQVLGMQLNQNDVLDIFTRLGFITKVEGDNFSVTVQTRRLDISIKEDLIEEIGRIYGYEFMEGILPTVPIKRGTRSKKDYLTQTIVQRLEGLGLQETINYSLNTKETSHQFTNDTFQEVTIANNMSEDRSVMRYSLLPSLVKVIEHNLARNIKNIKIFETGSSYSIKDNEYLEETKIAAAFIGEHIASGWQNHRLDVDFYVVKSVIQNILFYMGFLGRISYHKENLPKEFHPGRSAEIRIDNLPIGYIGQIHPNLNKKEIYLFELNLDTIMKLNNNTLIYQETPKFPIVHKDVAFIVPKEVEASDIMDVIRTSGGKKLLMVDVFDLYTGENIANNNKSIAFNLVFQDTTKTLEEEEITNLFNKIIHSVEKQLDAKLRDK